MGQPIQRTVDVLGNAANTVIDQGVLGALLILSFAVIFCLAWLLWRCRNKYTARLEKEADK